MSSRKRHCQQLTEAETHSLLEPPRLEECDTQSLQFSNDSSRNEFHFPNKEGDTLSREVLTRSKKPSEFWELPEKGEDYGVEEEEDEEEEQDESEGENVHLWEVNETEDEEEEMTHPWEQREEEEEEDDGVWKEEDDEEASEDEFVFQLTSDEEISSELRSLSTNASTLLLPEDVCRIRLHLRRHVQLLSQFLMFLAGLKKTMKAQTCARMLQDVVAVGRHNQLVHSVYKPYVKPVAELLSRFSEEVRRDPLVPDKPRCQAPIVLRFQQILTSLAPQLSFSSTLSMNVPKQKQTCFITEAEPKNWRTWGKDEIDLLVMGFERFGKERGVAVKVHESFLPTRRPQAINRLVCEAQGKKKMEPRFAPLLSWLTKYGETGVQLNDNEQARLLHGVAVQCERNNAQNTADIDFGEISSSFLPHRSAFVLKEYFEEMCVREADPPA